MKSASKWILFTTVLSTLFLLSGCNTVKGFGQDMQNGGQNIERTADENR